MNTQKFTVGQWVFFEFKLACIEQLAEDRVTRVTTGYMSCGALDMSQECFPLDVLGKIVSEEFDHQYNKLYNKWKHSHLNWPDLHRWFVSSWRELMQKRESKSEIEKGFVELQKFVSNINQTLVSLSAQTVDGVKLFR